MALHGNSRLRRTLTGMAALAGALGMVLAQVPGAAAHAAYGSSGYGFCAHHATLCIDSTHTAPSYIGHDEPSLLFYSNLAGSGNNDLYRLTLPEDPPTLPKQNGTGGTFNFQLHPTFWFGMAICDTQSAPEFTRTCTPDSDAHIFNSGDPDSPRYIGKHPGTAFMEMQFYPPGWVRWPAGVSCSARQWCAALNIDSLGVNQNTGQANNHACASTVGLETVNFAFVTKNGVAQAPANPVNATLATYTPNATRDLFMNSGDRLSVLLHDTQAGFQVVIHDETTHASGSMTASIANGFGQVDFDPKGTICEALPYAFHPMYSTSSPQTRVPWAAHSYNVAFSDEIGHFEYCNAVSGFNGTCTQAGVNDPSGTDSDDAFCFAPSSSTRVRVGGCLGSDFDFDGVPYQKVWPGTLPQAQDEPIHASAILFTSPVFNGGANYSRAAFETDLPALEAACNIFTGAHCVNPPPGAAFYPIYSTRGINGGCAWQFGGTHIPGTLRTFGGTSKAEYGPAFKLVYPTSHGPVSIIEDFRTILPSNPCPA